MAETKLISQMLTTKMSWYHCPVTNLKSAGEMTLADAFRMITEDKTAMQKTQQLRTIKDAKDARDFKAHNFDFVLFSGTFRSRKDEGLVQHSWLLCIDFDHLGYQLASIRERLLQDRYFKTWLLFRSPSGDGLKWVVGIDLNRGDHKKWFKAIQSYIRKQYQIEVDGQCVNVSRACFLPYDPNAYAAPEITNMTSDGDAMGGLKSFDIEAWSGQLPEKEKTKPVVKTPVVSNPADEEEEVKKCVEALVNCGKDITDGYENYRNVGFALADGLGEGGRDLYHKLCCMNEKYDSRSCDRQYSECLKARKTGITIRTFWQMAKDAGIDISGIARNAHAPMKLTDAQAEFCATCANVPSGITEQNPYNKDVHEELEDDVPVGTMAQVAQMSGKTFSDKLQREDIVSFLYPVLDSQPDDVGRDKMILGVLNIVSGLLPFSYFGIYDGRKVYAPVFNIIFGGFATSKGDLEFCRQIALPIKKEMRRQYEAEYSDYEEQKAQWDAKCTPKERSTRGVAPKEPSLKNPFVSANSSASAVYRSLDANEGWGIMFEPEADTLTNMLSKSEYGDYTDLLRKIHQHEECSMVRVSDKINIELTKPKLSVLLTCTGSQLPLLLPPNNVANGLASRFLFYALPDSKVEFRDVFARQDNPIEDIYKKLGEELLPLYHALEARKEKPIQFVLTKEKQHEFVVRFNSVLHEQFAMLGDGIQGFIFRMALECYRYAMVLTALRRLSEWNKQDSLFDDDDQTLVCDPRDFDTAMIIMECLVNHTARVFAVLGSADNDPFRNSAEKPSEEVKTFYKALPDGVLFRTAEALEVAAKQNISERTAKRLLGQLLTKFDVLEHPKQGVYIKKNISATQSSANGSTL